MFHISTPLSTGVESRRPLLKEGALSKTFRAARPVDNRHGDLGDYTGPSARAWSPAAS
jgi:hypothetical protein